MFSFTLQIFIIRSSKVQFWLWYIFWNFSLNMSKKSYTHIIKYYLKVTYYLRCLQRKKEKSFLVWFFGWHCLRGFELLCQSEKQRIKKDFQTKNNWSNPIMAHITRNALYFKKLQPHSSTSIVFQRITKYWI